MNEKKFRRTILAVFVNSNNKILLCLSDRDNFTWKFPQGGIEENETKIEALFREVKEEINIDLEEKDILSLGNVQSYFFEDGFEIKLNPYLVKYNEKKTIKISKDEFCDFQWIFPNEIKDLNLGVRRNAYINILKDFTLL